MAKFCQHCGTSFGDAAAFCTACGEPQVNLSAQGATHPVQVVPQRRVAYYFVGTAALVGLAATAAVLTGFVRSPLSNQGAHKTYDGVILPREAIREIDDFFDQKPISNGSWTVALLGNTIINGKTKNIVENIQKFVSKDNYIEFIENFMLIDSIKYGFGRARKIECTNRNYDCLITDSSAKIGCFFRKL